MLPNTEEIHYLFGRRGGGGAGVMAILTVYITGPSSSGCPVKRVLNKEEKHLYKMKKKIQLRAAIDSSQ